MTDAAVRTCYRHPGTAAGVVCQRCDRPICPQCMNQASVGFHCPECVRSGSQKVVRGPGTGLGRPVVTLTLIVLNVLVWGIAQVLGGGTNILDTPQKAIAYGGLFASGVRATPAGQPIGHLMGVAHGESYRLLTAGFLHVGIIHLAMNMWALWILGQVTEQALGRSRMVMVYFVSLFAGSFGALLLAPQRPAVGASGAIFGLLGGLLVVARARGIRLRDTGLLPVLGINLVITFTLSTYISVGAHIGGLIGGALAAFILVDVFERVPSLQSRGQTPAQRRRTDGVAGVVSVLLVLAFVMGSIAVANRAANSVPIGWFL